MSVNTDGSWGNIISYIFQSKLVPNSCHGRLIPGHFFRNESIADMMIGIEPFDFIHVSCMYVESASAQRNSRMSHPLILLDRKEKKAKAKRNNKRFLRTIFYFRLGDFPY